MKEVFVASCCECCHQQSALRRSPSLPKLFLRGVKTTLFRPPSKYYNSHWPTNLEYFTNRRVWVSRMSKSETRDHTRSNYSEDLLEQSSMTNSLKSDTRGPKISAKFNPHKLFQKSNFKFCGKKLGWASQLARPLTIHLIFSLDSEWKSNFWITLLNLTFLSYTFRYFELLLLNEFLDTIWFVPKIIVVKFTRVLAKLKIFSLCGTQI